MKSFPFLSTTQYLAILRITVSLLMMAHGIMRSYADTVSDFGEFLNAKGFMIGGAIAWGITLFEIAGGALLALGFARKIISAGFATSLTMGILLVHMENGLFVVGHGTGGVEYSVLLVISFLLVASTEK